MSILVRERENFSSTIADLDTIHIQGQFQKQISLTGHWIVHVRTRKRVGKCSLCPENCGGLLLF